MKPVQVKILSDLAVRWMSFLFSVLRREKLFLLKLIMKFVFPL